MTTSKAYFTGFAFSITLTVMAFLTVALHNQPGHPAFFNFIAVWLILGLAVIQLCAQLVFFLHLGREQKPRWNLNAFLITLSLVLIVVIGSLWIMNHLNYNMSPEQMKNYIKNSDAL